MKSATDSYRTAKGYLDRGEAVNLASNALHIMNTPPVTPKGQQLLARAVLEMDAELTRLYKLLEKPTLRQRLRNLLSATGIPQEKT